MQTALRLETTTAVAICGPITCPKCHGECRTLVREWRGYTFNQGICPICANTIAIGLLQNQITPPKALEN